MKGLLKNNFYGMAGNIKIALIFALVLGAALLISGNAAMLNVFCLIPTPIIAVLSMSCLRKESSSKWEKYKLTLPVRRKDIVKSQYISHLILCMGGTAFVALFLSITVFIHGNQYFYYGFRDAITLIMGGGILAILIGAFAYPLYYLWGAGKTEVISVLSVLGAAAVIAGISALVNIVSGDNPVSNTFYYASLIAILFIALFTFGLSNVLSCSIFKQKEY